MEPSNRISGDGETLIAALIPQPRDVELHVGHLDLGLGLRLDLRTGDPRVASAASDWLGEAPGTRAAPRCVVAVDSAVGPTSGAYRLAVRRDGTELIGRDVAGCFNGLQTLRHLCTAASPAGVIPCCTICDHPDFSVRGLLHDVTRGKVPTLSTLKGLVDRLALMKVNQLQLYIEHALVYSFDPEICDADSGLTPDEIRALDAYCRERFIDLVPAVATLGHMGRVLSTPRYRHLAEIEATQPWEAMPWPQRMRGFTLNCMDPEAHRLVEAMWSDVLDAFSSPVVNICGDEPWDLGKGKNKERLAAGCGAAYLAQIARTHEFCAARGRRTQFWSDVVSHYPELFPLVPRDSSVLHWGYDDRSDYEGTAKFVEAGMDTIVCPGTSGWKRLLNAMDAAERNIRTFAEAGKRHGANGLVNTDWGDYGHFNALACSWHGIALGAACGWRADHPTGPALDRAVVKMFFDQDDDELIRGLRAASRGAERCETWRLFWQPLEQVAKEEFLPSMHEAEAAAEAATVATRAMLGASDADSRCAMDRSEARTACRFTELFATRVRMAHAANEHEAGRVDRSERAAWAEEVEAATAEFARNWRARNKDSGLSDVQAALRHVINDARAASESAVCVRGDQLQPRPSCA